MKNDRFQQNKTNLKEKILDLFFPPKCLFCEQIGSFLCKDCKSKILPINSQTCPSCNKIFDQGKYCKRCSGKTFACGIISATYFKDPIIKEVIHAIKYQKISAAIPEISELITQKVVTEKINFDLITFVPSTRKRLNWRGFNQAEIMAEEIAKNLGKPFIKLLTKNKETKTQVGLKRKERIKNLASAFGIVSAAGVKGKTILLVDDVLTTGATINECAKVLKAAGAKKVWGAVLAKE